jgi:hypothetical protein
VEALSSKIEALSNEIRERCEVSEARFESSIRVQKELAETNLRKGLEEMKSTINSRFEVRLREETESLKVGIRNEIGTINSRFESTESRFRTETANRAELTVGALRGEIGNQIAATKSSFKSEIENRCAAVLSAIRTELREEQEWVRKYIPFTYVPLRASPLDGIIAFLERRAGGNVIDKDIIAATPGNNSRNAFDFHNTESYSSHNHDPEQWLAIDFKEMRVYVTEYSFRARPGATCNPRSWFLEGSQDGVTWFTLDAKRDRSELRAGTEPSTFSVSTPQYCRHLRFRKTRAWHDGCSYLEVTSIDFFGFLFAPLLN